MVTKEVKINNIVLLGYEIELPNAVLVLLQAPKGYIMCGYLNMEAANKFNDIAAVVKGICTVEELMDKEISAVSNAASAAGIKTGMTGRQGISLMI